MEKKKDVPEQGKKKGFFKNNFNNNKTALIIL